MTSTNLPNISNRVRKALDILADGGRMVVRLERNSHTGREQFQTRFMTERGAVIPGLGVKTKFELADAGFNLAPVHWTSGATYYKLSTGGEG